MMMEKLERWFSIWKAQKRIADIKNNKDGQRGSVLLIKLDAIGDFIIWLDSAKEYRNIYKGKKIYLLCNKLCCDIALSTGYFDEIYDLNLSKAELNGEYLNQMIEILSKIKVEVLLQVSYSRTLHMDIVAASIPANRKIAFVCDETRSNISRRLVSSKNRKKLDKIYDELIPASSENLMEVQRNKEFICGLGKKDFKSSTPKLKKMNEKASKVPPGDYIVIFPGASTKRKIWAVEKFAKIADYLIEKTELNIYVCGSDGEFGLGEQIRSMVHRKSYIINYCGKTDLLEVAEVIRNAKLIVSNDTSGIHYAAATGTPAVCVLGEYNYGRFLPYQADHNTDKIRTCSVGMKCRNCSNGHMTISCIYSILRTGRYACIEKISIEKVISEIDVILETK